VTVVPPAVAAPPTTLTIEDPVEPGKAFDVVSVTLASAPAQGRKATITIEHDRRVQVGDMIDAWVDTDADWVPDLFITGASYSEYSVYKTQSWTSHGSEITDQGCATLRMARRLSVVRVDPSCLAPSTRFSVSVRSYAMERPARTDDYVPGKHRFSKRVLSYLPE
jgi:PDZ domain-containing secreted protein